MNILVVGGTRFVGKKIVEAAVARDHKVTLFNRGQSNPGSFPELESLVGDRTNDLTALDGREWDAVIDVCGYWPKAIEPLCKLLENEVGRYVFVSTISVYTEDSPVGLTEESGELIEGADADTDELKMEHYGGLKVLCERAVQSVYGQRALIVRPGLVVGPGDHTDRFTYWPRKFMRPGPFLAPECLDAPIQVADGRDLGEFTVLATERGLSGAYHVAGPTPPMPFEEFVKQGVAASEGVAQPVWADAEFLEKNNVAPWSDLPLLGSFSGGYEKLASINNKKALAAGLSLRPIAETIADTIDWWRTERAGTEAKAGLSNEREAELLQSIKSKTP